MALMLLLCLILANAFLCQCSSEPFSSPPPQAPSPFMARKIGRHNNIREEGQVTKSFSAPTPSPTKEKESHMEEATSDSPKETAIDRESVLEPTTERNIDVDVRNAQTSNHHHSVDKSVAGGGVILGGLATAFLVAVFCYIRATGRSKNENISSVPSSPTTTSSSASSCSPTIV